MEQQLDALHLSRRARSQVVPQLVQFDATTRTALTYEAHKQTIQRYTQNLTNNFTALRDGGQHDQAAQVIASGEKSGLYSPEQAEGYYDESDRAYQKFQQLSKGPLPELYESLPEVRRAMAAEKPTPRPNGKS